MVKLSLSFLIVGLCVCAHAERSAALTLAEASTRVEGALAQSERLAPPSYYPEAKRAEEVEGLNSPWRALGYSLLLPGAGQIYGGAGHRAKFFLGAEVIVWGMALGFDRWSAWRNRDAVDFAVAHAQLLPEGKNDEFLENLEFYDNREEFNQAGRIIDPDRPFLPETRETYWQWDSFESRQGYRDLRNSAESASRNATFMFYFAALNRVVAALDAFRLVRKNNARARNEQGLKLSVKPRFSLRNPSLMLNASYRF